VTRTPIRILAVAATLLAGAAAATAPVSVAAPTAHAGATASSGAFTTVVPSGFRNETRSLSGAALNIQLVIIGPRAHGFSTNINVIREHFVGTDVAALARGQLTSIKRIYPKAHGFSAIAVTTVDRDPARAFAYSNAPLNGKLLHQRQVFVIHAGWAYSITYSALPGAAYSASLPALHQVIADWRWR
jgi:hypothetical protein